MPYGYSVKQRLYVVWMNMHNRCKNVKHPRYYRYGGRQITICEQWGNVASFRAWAEVNGYAHGLTLDRIDNNKGYSPENCRFVTYAENNLNRDSVKRGYLSKDGNQYRVRTSVGGKSTNLGRFNNKDDAQACLDAFRLSFVQSRNT